MIRRSYCRYDSVNSMQSISHENHVGAFRMETKLMVEQELVAASIAQSEGFENTCAALREIAKLWNELGQRHRAAVSEPPASVT